MQKIVSFGLPALASLVLSGCATLFSDSSYNVHIEKAASADSFKVVNLDDNTVVASGSESQSVVLEASDGFFNKAN